MPNIHEFWLKIKGRADDWLADWGIFALLIVATMGAFGLGRLSAMEAVRPLIEVHKSPQTVHNGPLVMGGMVVASRTGETYYYPWCAGAAKITPANQRVFLSPEAAKQAGLRPAKTCKGLE